MAIAKRPKNNPDGQPIVPLTEEERERQEQAFLASAPDGAGKQRPAEKSKRQKMQTVHLRFEPDLLPRMDAVARENGFIERAAWIRFIVNQALKNHEKV